jgi:Spy/CpxP family protein refolding chaperone
MGQPFLLVYQGYHYERLLSVPFRSSSKQARYRHILAGFELSHTSNHELEPPMTHTLTLAAAFVVAASTLMAAPAFADVGNVDAEYRSQNERIVRGIREGSLTRSEAVSLRAEQDRIAHMIERARRDGRIDPYERREIEGAQAVASRRIYAEKHDAEAQPQRRYGWWHRPLDGGQRRWW